MCLCVCSYAPNQQGRAPTHAVCALPLPANSTAKTPPATRRKPPQPSSPLWGAPTPGSVSLVNQPCADRHLWGFGPFTVTNSATNAVETAFSIFSSLTFGWLLGQQGRACVVGKRTTNSPRMHPSWALLSTCCSSVLTSPLAARLSYQLTGQSLAADGSPSVGAG